jgi:hypothetical protein
MGHTKITPPAENDPIRHSLLTDLLNNFGDVYAGSSHFIGVINGDFNIDSDGDAIPDGWIFTPHSNGHIGRTATSIKGPYAVYMSSPGGNFGGGLCESKDFIPASENGVYNLKWWMLASIATMRNQVEILFYDEDLNGFDSEIIFDEYTSNPIDDWTLVARSFTAPAGTRFMKVKINGGVVGHEIGGTVYFGGVDFFIPDVIGNATLDGADGDIEGTYTPPWNSIGAEVFIKFNATVNGGGDQYFGWIREVAVDDIGRHTRYFYWYPMNRAGIQYDLYSLFPGAEGLVKMIHKGALK